MSAGTGVPFGVPLASGVPSRSVVCCAVLGDGSAIVEIARITKVPDLIDASTLWLMEL
jgi:hypothetical protein